MKNNILEKHQLLIGYVILSIAIIIAGALIANAIKYGFEILHSSIIYLAELQS